ncbi:MAG: hypothetical protein GKR94_21655 [Gammaproteobacteria bacterium]|nr:hypothetical protein [Gammaproteobacteria bacterium]
MVAGEKGDLDVRFHWWPAFPGAIGGRETLCWHILDPLIERAAITELPNTKTSNEAVEKLHFSNF